jgi:hypothetical protein
MCKFFVFISLSGQHIKSATSVTSRLHIFVTLRAVERRPRFPLPVAQQGECGSALELMEHSEMLRGSR